MRDDLIQRLLNEARDPGRNWLLEVAGEMERMYALAETAKATARHYANLCIELETYRVKTDGASDRSTAN